MEVNYQQSNVLLERQNRPNEALNLVIESHKEGGSQNLTMSTPQNDARVTLPVGGADSVLFSDN